MARRAVIGSLSNAYFFGGSGGLRGGAAVVVVDDDRGGGSARSRVCSTPQRARRVLPTRPGRHRVRRRGRKKGGEHVAATLKSTSESH